MSWCPRKHFVALMTHAWPFSSSVPISRDTCTSWVTLATSYLSAEHCLLHVQVRESDHRDESLLCSVLKSDSMWSPTPCAMKKRANYGKKTSLSPGLLFSCTVQQWSNIDPFDVTDTMGTRPGLETDVFCHATQKPKLASGTATAYEQCLIVHVFDVLLCYSHSTHITSTVSNVASSAWCAAVSQTQRSTALRS